MKRLFLILALALSIGCSATAQKFIPVKERTTKRAQAFKTEYTYGQGTQDTIYLSVNGRAYYWRNNSKGVPTRKYLDEETSKQLCKEYGKEYKEPRTKKKIK